jgi:hypothetical protein
VLGKDLSAKYRSEHLSYDFDKRREVRETRLPQSPTIVVTMNNVRFLLVWKGTYVFNGGANPAVWDLRILRW